MSDYLPPGITDADIDRQFGSDPMSDAELTEFIEDHDGILREYHADHVAEGILDDDLPDAFEAWVVTLSEKELMKIINK